MSAQRTASALTAAVSAAVLGLMCIDPGPARAQAEESPRYREEPTAGVNLPTAGLAGEHDALSVSTNPAGLWFLGGWHLALAFDSAEPDQHEATGPGPGFGLFAAGALGGDALPRLAWGLGLEFLRPPRVALVPDPGTPTRFTLAQALPLGRTGAIGVAWHHFFDSPGSVTRGLDTFDLGLSMRMGSRFGVGFAVRDLTEPDVAGAAVQRRYELELVARPAADDRLELGVGGRLGENRADFESGEEIEGWARASVRLMRGLYLRGQYDNRSLLELGAGPDGMDSLIRREHRITAGLEVSFGGLGAATYASGTIDDDGERRFAGSTLVVRASQRGVPSLLSRPRRIERIELEGEIGERDLTRLIAQFRKLERDEGLAAVVLKVDGLSAGWATTSEIRRALASLRARGVRIYAYMVAGTTRHYYLASVADKIFVDPAGGLRLSGMVATSLYFKGLFDKLGILAQFEKIEEYKSAPEAYTRTGPTEPAFTMRNEIYDSMYEHVVRAIAAGRRISAARVRTLIDNGPYTSGDLEKIPELVDRIVTPDELAEQLVRELGAVYPVASAPAERDPRWDYPGIAIIYIDGDIIDGKSSFVPLVGVKLVGGDTIAAAIAAARESSQVEAIILRINSPGGSALASEVIAREVFKTRGRKPIICSMGDVAASGGYFAAAGCDTILADPMTVTGSIGIFTGKFDFSGLLGRVGVTWTTYKRGALADMDSMLKAYSQDEQRLMKRKLHYYYGRFLKAVAEGRELTTAKVDEVGRGRVWTGSQARPIRLIDRFGGIGEAIQLAKRQVGMDPDDEARLVLLPSESAGLLQRLLGGLAGARAEEDGKAERALLQALLPAGADRALLRAIPGSLWSQPATPQARLPFSIDWGD
jgi:protease IV